MRKGIAVFFLIMLIAGLLLYGYLRVPEIQEKIASVTEEDFTQDNIYSDIESLSMRLDEEILNGADSFVVYLKNMEISEIDGINKSLDGIYGSGSTYQQVGVIGNTYIKVRISINKTINYYAVQAYLGKEAIPTGQPKAKELYEVISLIMKEQIHDGMTDYEKELALHDYLVTHCKYSSSVNAPAKSDIYRAYGALVNGDAVCNGYAEAMQLLLHCAGVPSRFVIGRAKNSGNEWIDHAWNLVQIDGQWYHLDATWNDPVPDGADEIVHPYFNVTDEILKENHEWVVEDYPKATTMESNFYVKEKQFFPDIESYQKDAYEDLIYGSTNRYEGVIENYQENEDNLQFIFEGNDRYNSISWQTFQMGTYSVLVIEVE